MRFWLLGAMGLCGVVGAVVLLGARRRTTLSDTGWMN